MRYLSDRLCALAQYVAVNLSAVSILFYILAVSRLFQVRLVPKFNHIGCRHHFGFAQDIFYEFKIIRHCCVTDKFRAGAVIERVVSVHNRQQPQIIFNRRVTQLLLSFGQGINALFPFVFIPCKVIAHKTHSGFFQKLCAGFRVTVSREMRRCSHGIILCRHCRTL